MAAGSGTGRVDLHRGVDEERPQRRPPQRLRRGLRRLAGGAPHASRGRACRASTPTSVPRWVAPQDDPAGLSDDDYLALLTADGADLDAVAALADELRRDAVGDDVTYVVNRNINFTNVCYVGCRFCAFAQRKTDADAYTLSLDEVGDGPPRRRSSAPPRSACRAGSPRT